MNTDSYLSQILEKMKITLSGTNFSSEKCMQGMKKYGNTHARSRT
jgi:hypothetical protein